MNAQHRFPKHSQAAKANARTARTLEKHTRISKRDLGDITRDIYDCRVEQISPTAENPDQPTLFYNMDNGLFTTTDPAKNDSA